MTHVYTNNADAEC